MIVVNKIKSITDKEKAFQLRHQVFIIEQAVDPKEEYDEDDEKCTHFIARLDGVVCGTARWRFKSKGIIKLERFAVDLSHRKKGVGAALVKAVIDDLPYAEKIILHAQVHAVPFYEKLGFETYGPEFDEAGIQHYAMQFKKIG